MTDISGWVTEELASVDLRDKRLNNRCHLLLGTFFAKCQASIPVACRGWAEIKGAYRFFTHNKVTLESVIAPHQDATLMRIALEEWVGFQRVMDYARAWEAFGPEKQLCGN